MTPNIEKWILAGFWIAVLTSLLFGHWAWAVVGATAGVIFQERGRFTAQVMGRVRSTAVRAKAPESPVATSAPHPIDPEAEKSDTAASLALDIERLHALVEDERQVEMMARGNLIKHQESSSPAILPEGSGPQQDESFTKAPSNARVSTTIDQWRAMSASERDEFISKRDSLSNSNRPGGPTYDPEKARDHRATMPNDGDVLTTPPTSNSQIESLISD